MPAGDAEGGRISHGYEGGGGGGLHGPRKDKDCGGCAGAGEAGVVGSARQAEIGLMDGFTEERLSSRAGWGGRNEERQAFGREEAPARGLFLVRLKPCPSDPRLCGDSSDTT